MSKSNKTTVIIAVYKNTASLKLVLEALDKQSVAPHEIIIAEDGESDVMQTFVQTLSMENIVHITQEDLGWRKARSINNAIKKATGDYFIFIDGDVIPHSRFIEGHLAFAEPKIVCCGKRSELGPEITKEIYTRKRSFKTLTDHYLLNAYEHHKDGARHYEEGIYLSPTGLLYRFLKDRHVRYIIGCNFSCYKEDMLSINGFDEDYTKPSVGEDIDLGWRFRGLGIELRSCRNIANVYHLYHEKNFDRDTLKENDAILKKNFDVNRYVCLNGLEKKEKEQ